MIQVKPWLIRSMEIQIDKKKHVLEYRSEVRDERTVYIVLFNGKEVYVGDEIRNTDTLFTTFWSLTNLDKNGARRILHNFFKKKVLLSKRVNLP